METEMEKQTSKEKRKIRKKKIEKFSSRFYALTSLNFEIHQRRKKRGIERRTKKRKGKKGRKKERGKKERTGKKKERRKGKASFSKEVYGLYPL